jgi:N-acetylglucosamine-6-phosphate deacetylase
VALKAKNHHTSFILSLNLCHNLKITPKQPSPFGSIEVSMAYQGINCFTGNAVEIEIAQDRISNIREIKYSQGLPYVSAGFLDMQVNGYMGSDYSLENLTEDHVRKIIHFLQTAGTTQHVPTIITSPRKQLLKNIRKIIQAMNQAEDTAAAIVGIHIEGPFISDRDGPRGAHDGAYIREPDIHEFQEWQAAAEGHLKIITLAPERKGALDFIHHAAHSGVKVAIGHTAADPAVIRDAINAGASLATHLGNGCHGSLPRLHNPIWEQLAADELTAGIICDGFHLPSSVVKVFFRAKGLKRLVLVSDAALLAGYKPGVYKWGHIDVEVHQDGHLGLAGTEFLAGAAHLFDWDIPRFMAFTGADLAETIPLCTVNPARILGLPQNYGKLEVGAPANLVLFDFFSGDERLAVIKTVRNGQEVFCRT